MRKQAPVVLVLAAVVFWLAASHPHAQQPQTDYSLLMSPDQARAFVAARTGDYVPGQTLVKFREGAAPADQTRALSALRRGTTGSSRWIGNVLLVSTPGDPDSEAVAATLSRQPEVEWAQPNYLRKPTSRPNDPSYSIQWNLDLIDMPRAWDINSGASAAVTVAVIDSGVTTTNTTPSFQLWTGQRFETVAMPFRIDPDISSTRIKPGRDFVFWNGPVLDMDGHGTYVAGTILEETNNNLGTAGIAYHANLLPLKVCFGYWEIQLLMGAINQPGFADPNYAGCPDNAIGEAIRYAADSGAQVINISLSGGAPSPFLLDALNYAVSRGSFIAMAVGNEFSSGNPVEYPAAYAAQIDGAVAVGAVNRSSKRAPYSNTGSHVEIVAPGGDFTDGGFNGLVTQVTLDYTDSLPSVLRPRFDRYTLVSGEGTSAATPHLTGVAALLYSQGITSPAAIEAVIERTATDLGTSGRDPEYGFGLVNARAALRGMGLVK